jgi:prepilin-type N-terminal cleavage/methylation domain-containing protein
MTTKGFTLIELLVVIGIIGILAAVGIPSYKGYTTYATNKQAQISVRTIAAAEETYYLLNGLYFFSSGSTTSKCDANTSSTTQIETTVLKSTSKIDTKYFYYCVYGNASLTPPIFNVMAVKITDGSKFAINQAGETSTCNPSSVSACDSTNRYTTF